MAEEAGQHRPVDRQERASGWGRVGGGGPHGGQMGDEGLAGVMGGGDGGGEWGWR